MRLITLGPKGTFSEQAALKYKKDSGKDFDIVFSKNIGEIFESVNSGLSEEGILPVENMIDGSVGETLDLLYRYNLNIIEEVIVPIKMCLVGLGEINDVKKVLSKDKALGQCIDFIRKNGFDTQNTLSTADAMKIVFENHDKSIGAIGTELAVEEYGLKILKREIEDRKNNITRFFVISKNKIIKEKNGNYKTSIVISPKIDRPGMLHDLLRSFSFRGINLTKIESRPTKVNLGEYIFYVDLEGHEDDKNVLEAIKEIKKHNNLKVFGSYKRRY